MASKESKAPPAGGAGPKTADKRSRQGELEDPRPLAQYTGVPDQVDVPNTVTEGSAFDVVIGLSGVLDANSADVDPRDYNPGVYGAPDDLVAAQPTASTGPPSIAGAVVGVRVELGICTTGAEWHELWPVKCSYLTNLQFGDLTVTLVEGGELEQDARLFKILHDTPDQQLKLSLTVPTGTVSKLQGMTGAPVRLRVVAWRLYTSGPTSNGIGRSGSAWLVA